MIMHHLELDMESLSDPRSDSVRELAIRKEFYHLQDDWS